MIKLKTGIEIPYNEEFDKFFQALLDSIIQESYREAKKAYKGEGFNELVLKEVMDNCIYVTHQLFEIARDNEALSKFMVTGFLFNSVVLGLSNMQEDSQADADGSGEKDGGVVH